MIELLVSLVYCTSIWAELVCAMQISPSVAELQSEGYVVDAATEFVAAGAEESGWVKYQRLSVVIPAGIIPAPVDVVETMPQFTNCCPEPISLGKTCAQFVVVTYYTSALDQACHVDIDADATGIVGTLVGALVNPTPAAMRPSAITSPPNFLNALFTTLLLSD